jgi:pimeloyl-ACP methyl ester carboxylesterase
MTADEMATDPLRDDEVQLPAGPRLALRGGSGSGRPFLLVHGLSSNARLWDGVTRRLVAAGHEVVSVDLRGHGRSEQTADGYTTDQAADDLADLCLVRGLTGDREPIAAGQSWGGNVVVSLAARRRGVAGLALVDGGWIALGERFATFEECWAVLAPPVFDGVPFDGLPARVRQWHPDWPEEGVAGTVANFAERPDGTAVPWLTREHHRDILRSLWEGDPRPHLSQVTVPVLVAPALPHDADDSKRAVPRAALDLLTDARVSWYTDADHDLHAQQPDRLVADLLELAARVEDRAG